MGFYAPYKPEQRSLWLIAFSSVLGTCRDVVRYIAKKHLLHWFESKTDYCFSVDCGRIYEEVERNILNNIDLHFVETKKDFHVFLCSVCAAYMKTNKNVLLFCDKKFWLVSIIANMFDEDLIRSSNYTELTLVNGAILTLMTRDQNVRTNRGSNADIIVISDFDNLEHGLFYQLILPRIAKKDVKLLCFYQSYTARINVLQQKEEFDFIKY